jgi:hypothetical protein
MGRVLGDLRCAPRGEIDMSAQLTITIPVWLDRVFTWPMMVYRRCKYGYDFRRINLGDDEWTIVEPADYYRFGHLNWHLGGNKRKIYAVRTFKTSPGRITMRCLHREITDAPKGLVVDHKNGCSLDNRRANLRLATRSQNAQNTPKQKNTSSQYIGVSFHKHRKKWTASMKYEGKRIWLGYYENEIDAAKAYDQAAMKYYGEFAKVNFSNEPKPALTR